MNNLFKKCILILIINFFSSSLLSQISNQKNQEFFKHLYNFNFSKADSLLTSIDSIREPNQFNFLKSHFMRWYYLPIHEQNEKILSQYNQYLEATQDAELDYIFVNNALLKAEFNYNQGNYYKAYQNGVKVYEAVNDSLDSRPDRIELKFLASLYHYFYQYYKSENPVFGPLMWFFKEGDKNTGLRWLEEVASQESIVRAEALIYLSHIYLRLENEPERAFHYAETLHRLYPDNLKFHELYIESLLATGSMKKEDKGMIEELMKADKVYFQKYGKTYNALFLANSDSLSLEKRLQIIQETKDFVSSLGKANHLMSLLLFQEYKLTSEESVFETAADLMVYQYELTSKND